MNRFIITLCLSLSALLISASPLFAQDAKAAAAAEKEAKRLEKLIAPWVSDTTVAVFHVNLKELRLQEVYDRTMLVAKRFLKRTLSEQNEATQIIAMVEEGIKTVEQEFAAVAAAGGGDVFVVVDMKLVTRVPALIVLPVDVSKKKAVSHVVNLLRDAEWIPEMVKEDLARTPAGVIGNYVVFAPSPAYVDEDEAPALLESIRENITAVPRPELLEGLTITAGSAIKGMFLMNDMLRMAVPTFLEGMKADAPEDLPIPTAKTLIQGVKVFALEFDFYKDYAAWHILSETPAAAKKLHGMLDVYKNFILKKIDEQADNDQPVVVKHLAADMVDFYYDLLVPECDGKHIFWSTKRLTDLQKDFQDISGIMTVSTGSVLVGLLLPAVASAREAAQRMQGQNNLKNLALAMHLYEGKFKRFPASYTVDKNQKPLHSWRVTLLPNLEQEGLYKAIRHDEPWDSEWNSQFHEQMPAFYANPRFPAGPGMTTYAVVTGKETMFPPGGKGLTVASCADGLSNTIMLVERTPVCWMDPSGDVDFEDAIEGFNVMSDGLISIRGIMSAAFFDGSVRAISDSVDLEVLGNLLKKASGEMINHDDF